MEGNEFPMGRSYTTKLRMDATTTTTMVATTVILSTVTSASTITTVPARTTRNMTPTMLLV